MERAVPVEVLRKRYEAGASLTALAGWAGMPVGQVRARLVSAGVVLRGRGPRRELAVPLEELRGRYEAGASTTELAVLAGVSASTVWTRLAGAGVALRGRGAPRAPRVPLAVPVAELRGRYESGETIGELAVVAGVSYSTLRRRLKAAGVEPQQGRRPVRRSKRGAPRMPLAVPVAELRRRYERGKTIRDLAAVAGVSYSTLRQRLQAADAEPPAGTAAGTGGAAAIPTDQEGSPMAQVPASEVRRGLDLLSERAEAAWPVVSGGAGGLSLAEAGAAVESLTEVLESVWQMLGPVVERVAQIHEREMGERRDGRGRELTEQAWVHLDCGRDGLMVAYRLLSTGRGDLLTVERGED